MAMALRMGVRRMGGMMAGRHLVIRRLAAVRETKTQAGKTRSHDRQVARQGNDEPAARDQTELHTEQLVTKHPPSATDATPFERDLTILSTRLRRGRGHGSPVTFD